MVVLVKRAPAQRKALIAVDPTYTPSPPRREVGGITAGLGLAVIGSEPEAHRNTLRLLALIALAAAQTFRQSA